MCAFEGGGRLTDGWLLVKQTCLLVLQVLLFLSEKRLKDEVGIKQGVDEEQLTLY